MDMVLSPMDTCIKHSKVKSLLYTCPFGPLVDGILLDPRLPWILRFECYTCIEEEVKRKGTTTPFAREAWKRRRKREEEAEPRSCRRRTSVLHVGPFGLRS